MSNLNNNTTQLELLLQKVNELPAAGGGEDVTAETNEYTSLNTELEEVINSLPDAGGGGGSAETCTVTITQEWGMKDDPGLLYVFVSYYDVLADGSIQLRFEELTSADDFEPQHSITFTAYKNIPINIIARSGGAAEELFTVSANGGTYNRMCYIGVSDTGYYSLTPTSNTATFTFASA